MDGREALTVALQDAPPHVSMGFFFCLLTSKRLLRGFPVFKVQGTDGHSFKADKVTLHLALREDHRKANWFCVLFLKKEKLQSQLSPKCYL